MSAFYTGLRDNTAATLIAQFGRDASLRKDTGTYDPSTGVWTENTADTAIKVVQLPRGKTEAPEFSPELAALFDQMVLISAKETAAASVAPKPDDVMVIGGEVYRIVAVAPIAPGGISVIYKAGIAGAATGTPTNIETSQFWSDTNVWDDNATWTEVA